MELDSASLSELPESASTLGNLNHLFVQGRVLTDDKMDKQLIYIHTYVHIYIYIYRARERERFARAHTYACITQLSPNIV